MQDHTVKGLPEFSARFGADSALLLAVLVFAAVFVLLYIHFYKLIYQRMLKPI